MLRYELVLAVVHLVVDRVSQWITSFLEVNVLFKSVVIVLDSKSIDKS